MRLKKIIIPLFALLCFCANAQDNLGAEIVSKKKFGDGVMVVKAKIVHLSGAVNNMFFYNRADKPWNNRVWYEYDWEIRGKYPSSGWSQVRVRNRNGAKLKDSPKNLKTNVNLSKGLYNYILIRKGNKYVYDIRKNFNPKTYNFNQRNAHHGNSVSLINGGPRIYHTGRGVSNIPSSKKLDFNLGITAFDDGWAGRLPNGSYSKSMEITYARFYEFKNNSKFLKTSAVWKDEFNGKSIQTSKWQIANWRTAKTQFRKGNATVKNGKLYLKINRRSGKELIGEETSSEVIERILEPGIQEPEYLLDENFTVTSTNSYPNPFQSSTVIRLDNEEKIKDINIYDAYGNLVKTYENVDENEYMIGDNLDLGLYFLKIKTDDNHIRLLKIIKN